VREIKSAYFCMCECFCARARLSPFSQLSHCDQKAPTYDEMLVHAIDKGAIYIDKSAGVCMCTYLCIREIYTYVYKYAH